ncbi:IS21 family transposase [Saccharopolyspora phatthalungensis]|uniref:Transposase n=1 Tax=Saccharopolyspora phatthalungensis TaxID=664693 RepID=A0A840QBV4_9PSEU|nr:IS21 family transposase [Saccharopolyspora phatthalungensis]MBB5155986.1 transposase [Saccharopolyspora phatthalungensis]MBB5157281.1 transposase [Saccharopolyspora phatthalungensis]MBB5157474.1 transposase [Saccharopolyspora phatthalungensis]MBB5158249.1 transposase [Saccharopolyspora phatthalungensis]MBB5159709.1 transposase [Saccharopolyspora phatthalungensis]
MSRVELFARIRRDRRLEPDLSVRALAERYGVHRRTVREALESAVPKERKKPPPRRSVLEPAYGLIDEMLRADLSAPRKQKHTTARIYQRLITEHGFTAAGRTVVYEYVARRRPELVAELREEQRHLQGMVPQQHQPGEEAEVDFADVWVRVAGTVLKCHLFTLRLSFSGRAVHRVFLSEGQEAFMEGHVEAFRALGGIPTRHIRYDNLRPAVQRVCFGRSRVESQNWVKFRSHFGFDAFYCIPGKDGAHEKGGVEQEGGRFRRTHLVPVPEVASLTELNEKIAAIDLAEDERILHGQRVSIGFNFAHEAELLAPVPFEEFDTGSTLTPKVGRDSRITVRQSQYSVPARFIGRKVRVSLRANEVLVFDRTTIIARHVRLTRRGESHDELDHYLEILLGKPGALAGSTALATARAEGTFTSAHEAFWSAARAAHGNGDGTRALIEVLLLHRRLPAEAVITGITTALDAGSTSPELVAIEARKAAASTARDQPLLDDADLSDLGIDTTVIPKIIDDTPDPREHAPPTPVSTAAPVISLRSRRELPATSTPLPSVAIYDQLLRRTKGTSA